MISLLDPKTRSSAFTIVFLAFIGAFFSESSLTREPLTSNSVFSVSIPFLKMFKNLNSEPQHMIQVCIRFRGTP